MVSNTTFDKYYTTLIGCESDRLSGRYIALNSTTVVRDLMCFFC